MLPFESEWIGSVLAKISKSSKEIILLNVGSSTENFRKVEQPYIHQNIFGQLSKKLNVVHLDMKKAEGVDLVGDLMDDSFLMSIQEKYNVVLCSNLLEHVVNPQKVIDRLEEIIPVGGYIIVTGPYLFPYHNDPIDTKFRPSVKDLSSMFKKCSLVEGKIINEAESHFRMLKRKPRLALLSIIRLFTPFYKPNNWLSQIKDIPNLFKPFQVVAVLLRREK